MRRLKPHDDLYSAFGSRQTRLCRFDPRRRCRRRRPGPLRLPGRAPRLKLKPFGLLGSLPGLGPGLRQRRHVRASGRGPGGDPGSSAKQSA